MSAYGDLTRAIECGGKERYRSFALAAKIAKRRTKFHDGERLQAYRCRWCHNFHIGTPKERQDDERREIQARAE